jgi:hypothetical protein
MRVPHNVEKHVFYQCCISWWKKVLSFQCQYTRHCAGNIRWGNERQLEQMLCGEFHKLWHFENYWRDERYNFYFGSSDCLNFKWSTMFRKEALLHARRYPLCWTPQAELLADIVHHKNKLAKNYGWNRSSTRVLKVKWLLQHYKFTLRIKNIEQSQIKILKRIMNLEWSGHRQDTET